MSRCRGVTDVSGLAGCPGLHTLELAGSDKLMDAAIASDSLTRLDLTKSGLRWEVGEEDTAADEVAAAAGIALIERMAADGNYFRHQINLAKEAEAKEAEVAAEEARQPRAPRPRAGPPPSLPHLPGGRRSAPLSRVRPPGACTTHLCTACAPSAAVTHATLLHRGPAVHGACTHDA